MDADVEQLVREDRLLEAARLASDRGDAAVASALFERACEWRSAAADAMRAGEPLRALDLALRADDTKLAEAAAARLGADPAASERAAAHLSQRGRHAWAARVLEAAGQGSEAAQAWEHGGEMTRAAALYEGAGRPAEAARALEAAVRRDPEAHAASLALGTLLARFGKDAGATRALQRIPAHAPERREALEHLAAALERLGLKDAAREAGTELAALGGSGSGTAEPATRRLYGRYEAVRAVASSARARLLEGLDRGLGERVALKVYATAGAHAGTRAALARLEADVLAVRAFDHPAIVPVRDFHPGGPTVVLAWMEGGSLEGWLARGPIAPDRAAEVAASVLSALGEAHRLGMLHRDVKPANVLFDGAGAARLTDFGAAHAADASATVTAGDLGVLEYLSPEQRAGREATVQSDVYAVGILLREMLAARQGHPGAALEETHQAFLAWLTAPDPRERAADAFQALDRLLSLPWPSAPRAGASRAAPVSVAALPDRPRLEMRTDGTATDAWTGRALERVPLSEATLERARFFARADHAGLQTVLRVDRDEGCLWLAACDPVPDRPLAPAELERLQGALEALRAAGMPAPESEATAVAADAAGGVVLRFVPRGTG